MGQKRPYTAPKIHGETIIISLDFLYEKWVSYASYLCPSIADTPFFETEKNKLYHAPPR
jgi:hypothetical protein